MTTDKEQKAFGLVLERHKSSSSENDIRTAFQRFMETAGLAAASEMTTEIQPGQGNPGSMDPLHLQHMHRVQKEYFAIRQAKPQRHCST